MFNKTTFLEKNIIMDELLVEIINGIFGQIRQYEINDH